MLRGLPPLTLPDFDKGRNESISDGLCEDIRGEGRQQERDQKSVLKITGAELVRNQELLAGGSELYQKAQ